MTDQGTKFMSVTLEEVHRMLQVERIRTSPVPSLDRWVGGVIQCHPEVNAEEVCGQKGEGLG